MSHGTPYAYIQAYMKACIQSTKLLKKNYFEKFIEKLDFVELSTQDKHLKVWILYHQWPNDSHNIINF